MSNHWFQFKQFTVWHDKCAMKVGTDGVLLGAWANIESDRSILDVGTGTGLIALMIAQRSAAVIDAIDIDNAAVEQALENVARSPFGNSITVHYGDFIEYAVKTEKRYDHIISNPPYFKDSLKGPDGQRNKARHADMLPLTVLLSSARTLLTKKGRISLIFPATLENDLPELLQDTGLYLHRKTRVLPTPGAFPNRILIELSGSKCTSPVTDELVIETSRHVYSPEYIRLTQDFYLKM